MEAGLKSLCVSEGQRFRKVLVLVVLFAHLPNAGIGLDLEIKLMRERIKTSYVERSFLVQMVSVLY